MLGQHVLNISSSSENVRAYGFSGTAPSAFHATECGTGRMQLLIINLDALENVSVVLPEQADLWTSKAQSQARSSYVAWVLTAPLATARKSTSTRWKDGHNSRNASAAGGPAKATAESRASTDPFSTDVLLNGHLLPDTVSSAAVAGASVSGSPPTVGFLEHIPVQPLTIGAMIELPPVSVAFLCSSDEPAASPA